MGNASSSPTTGHHNRLSKPKTNTNSPHGTPKVNVPVSVYSNSADSSVRDKQQFKTLLTSPVVTDFDSDASPDGDDTLGDLANHVQRRLSTLSGSNSITSHRGGGRNSLGRIISPHGSKLSLASNSQSVDLDTALKILQEVRKTASPEDLVALHQALQETVPPSSVSPTPDNSLRGRTSTVNRSSSSLIRRRSLIATPGLATRGSPTDTSRRTWNSWKGTDMEQSEDPKWKVGMMGNSPLTRIAALDLAEDGRESPVPRAQTPGDMEYSHLGSLQLGSLIVTNGAASPAGSARYVSRRKSAIDVTHGEDYFASTSGNASTEPKTRDRSHSRSKSSVLPPTFQLHPDQYIARPKANTKASRRVENSLQPGTVGPRTRSDHSGLKAIQIPTQSADLLAKDYMLNIPASPFENPRDDTPDEGFADGPLENASQPIQNLAPASDAKSPRDSIKSQITRKPSARDRANYAMLNCMGGQQVNAEIDGPDAAKLTTKGSNQEARIEVPPAERRRSRRPVPRKADSGYSSGGSLRTNRTSSDKGDRGHAPEKPSTSVVEARTENGTESDTVSLYTFEQMLALTQKPLPPLPSIDNSNEKQGHYDESTVFWYDEGKILPTQEVKEVTFGRNSVEPSPISPRTIQSAASFCTTDSSASRRLQKRRPSLQELPVVQSCSPIVEGSIPRVPSPVRAQFVRRLSEAPEMECLTRTYLSKEHVNSAEIVVDSPTALAFERSHFQFAQQEEVSGSQADRAPTPPLHGVRRSLSIFRGKTDSERKSLDKAAPTILDLGTIAQGLGGSPYDVAMATVPRQRVTSPTHPHQLGNSLPRCKSLVSMDAETAAEIARVRSKDRSAAAIRPEMPRRPRSYHDGHKNSAVQQQEQHSSSEAHKGRYYARKQQEATPHPHGSNVAVSQGASPHSTQHHSENAALNAPTEDIHAPGNSVNPTIRARSTGRGPVVSNLIVKYDQHGQKTTQGTPDWDAHARLWQQRRKSIGEGLRQRADAHSADPSRKYQRASTEPPEEKIVHDRYGGGLEYGYERGYGVGGSAGTRQLHSAASRKSMQYRHKFGVDLSDVPIFIQRT
ncbi:hypothetical protein BU24DRAFT_450633 [Aaosphaeria arxii CBS 175.79]|uniref:Uncharacterized protein n=1 Tax=Aaosphaeria arxii CBS 175.79 TaxID=1450172 RepID=A0A6A5XUV1_9PLEO|nr:uncharacterized protein BU24DRAFT_450633 [Aaosphaeria arxii CBS 175.79]KAF2016024.1 hypothetical protein BU24DRAFT_450633 [Aaosphaeria arxii CBS 175.79]